jgi:hypothetical protein
MASFVHDSRAPFTPAAVMPAQLGPRFASQPEKRLLVAILENALATARRDEVSSPRRRRSPRGEARAWIFSDDARWPFSYVNVCGMLGIDPRSVRQSLLQARTPNGRVRSRARLNGGSRTRMAADRRPGASHAS